MTRTARLLLFAVAVLVLAPAGVVVAMNMPAFGSHELPYGDAVNSTIPAARHISNMVSAVNFDVRGLDTLGEEFMLVCAVTGTVVLLRGERGEKLTSHPAQMRGRLNAPRSDALVLTGRLMGPMVLLFGLYVVLHATVTPGGGFQGGVVISSGLLLLYLCEDYQTWRWFMRAGWLDACEGGGALIFVLAGAAPLCFGAHFLQNIMPLGKFRDMLSGGLMQIVNAAVACAVLGGFALVFLEFLEETREPRGDP
ncbi:MAG TPA: MnhB domain-containing protein [Acetobacteraceae bacterium]|nr:MnhB domain-containing protein [Acetobacteraceae bacterium]